MEQDTVLFLLQVVQVGVGACVLGSVLYLIAKKRGLGLEPRPWRHWFLRSLVVSLAFYVAYYGLLLVPGGDSLETSVLIARRALFYATRIVLVLGCCWLAFRLGRWRTLMLAAAALASLWAADYLVRMPLLILALIMIGGI